MRIDGAGATHDLLEHLQALNARRTVRYTVGWMMTEADEKAIAALPETQWQTSLHQDGTVQEEYGVAELDRAQHPGWVAGEDAVAGTPDQAVAQAPEEADTVRTQDRLAVSGRGYQLLRRTRKAEADDPHGRRWPRGKATDDATVLYLALAN